MTLDGAKQAVANYAGSYCQEFNELRNNLDDGCEVLQQVLVSDVPGPQVKLNVGQLEASKRKNLIFLKKSYVKNRQQVRQKTSKKYSKILQKKFLLVMFRDLKSNSMWDSLRLPNVGIYLFSQNYVKKSSKNFAKHF